MKTVDGSLRAHRPALAAFLAALEFDLPNWRSVAIENSRGEPVGELVAAS